MNLLKERPSGLDWSKFRQLPKEQPDFLIDTTAINKRLALRKDNPFRMRYCGFLVPQDAKPAHFEQLKKQALERWIQMEKREGWTLVSHLRVSGPYHGTCVDPKLNEGMYEYRWEGKFGTLAKPVRYELPKELIKQAPDHKITGAEAVRLWAKHGMKFGA